jgi:hypothetical protein
VSNRSWHHIISKIKKFQVGGGAGTMTLSKGKGCFIKDDMPRDDNSIAGEIKAAVSFMVSRVA